MQRVVVRVWLPDRPGALGQVASRIGAVHGDVEGIEILERGGGRAIDELVVSLPAGADLDLLASEIGEVDGVDVEEIRALTGDYPDPVEAALAVAASLVEGSASQALDALCRALAVNLEADWAAVVGRPAGRPAAVLAAVGDAPAPAWLSAFVEGAEHLQGTGADGPPDLAWSGLTRLGAAVALGRSGRPFRARERALVVHLARVADAVGARSVVG